MIDAAMDRIIDHLEDLPEAPAADTGDAEAIAADLHEPRPPETGTALEDLLDTLFDEAIPASLTTPHPGYLAYIPGGGVFHAAVADLIADATNRYVGTWFAAPALARIEADVIEWFCRMVAYPDEAFGLLTTGGSMANQIAITTARRERLPEDFLDGTLYVSDQAHHSVAKAAVLAGFPADNVCKIPSDDTYRIDVDALETTIAQDRADGDRPFLVVANAGSTNTGAVDDLAALADLCQDQDLWLHADAAYGGFFALTDEGQSKLAGLDRAHSITLDPHKGLFLPYGTGALLVREAGALHRAHAVTADYIPEHDPSSDLVDFSQISPELSRDFRGLRVWLPLKLHGLGPFRANLQEKLELARWAADGVASLDHVTMVAWPQLSTLAFRLEPPGVQGEALDALNRAWMDAVNQRSRVHLSGTTLDGRFTVRISVLSFRTHRAHVDACIEDLAQTADEVLADAGHQS